MGWRSLVGHVIVFRCDHFLPLSAEGAPLALFRRAGRGGYRRRCEDLCPDDLPDSRTGAIASFPAATAPLHHLQQGVGWVPEQRAHPRLLPTLIVPAPPAGRIVQNAAKGITMSAMLDIVVTKNDHHRLSRLIERLRREGKATEGSGADLLEEELDRAFVVDPYRVPATVVTMNSEVEATALETGQTFKVTIVFPAEASAKAGRVSVLAPLGLALLGSRVGEEITWTMPGGVRRLRVDNIRFQPEAAGLFGL
jgi:regulator of nucleoside diphosphate kinase